jgi:hypothetical protein
MLWQIRSRKETIYKNLKYRKIGENNYAVNVDEKKIGTVYKADAVVNNFRRHFLDGTKTVDRWFAKTNADEILGPRPPYSEGFTTRREATIELFETAFGVRRDPKSY